MTRHILDRPVWDALATRQTQAAVGGAFARRFAPNIGPLAASCDDSPQSLDALAELVPLSGELMRPGPFETGTARLGDFLGIKENNVLVAMAGERMKHLGYAEISGVCVHPSARGRNYARALSTAVAARIIDRGETPYLHAYATNTSAIRLYESIGFRLRCPVHVATIARQGSDRL